MPLPSHRRLDAASRSRRQSGRTPLHSGPGSLEEVFRSQRANLVSSLSRSVGTDAACDLVQDAFCRAANSKQASQLHNPVAFLRRIARNLLIDRIRQERRRETIVSFDDAIDAPTAATQEDELQASDLLRAYEGALDRMPGKTRQIFLLHRVEERSYREIHELLGISVAGVEYHMMKALACIGKAVDHTR